MESDASSGLFSDLDEDGTDAIPIMYALYHALKQNGAKPPCKGYVLCTSSGESEDEEEETDHQIALKLSNLANEAPATKTRKKGKSKKKRTAPPCKLYTCNFVLNWRNIAS